MTHATIRTSDGHRTVTALLGPQVPTVSGGIGGWSEVTRPRRSAVAEWTGTGLMTATLQLVLDGYATGRPVTGTLAALTAMAPRDTEPPGVRVSGAWPIPPEVTWAIQSLTPSDQILSPAAAVLRVTVTIELIERALTHTVVRSSPAKRHRSRTGTGSDRARTRTYTVRSGDTLGAIAARLLGTASRWREIATLNRLRDPNRLTVGQRLRIPR